MFSGGDSSGDGASGLKKFGNKRLVPQSASAFGLKPTAAAGASIDWATLAQQWIQMRDCNGADIGTEVPDAPPPPNISGTFSNVKSNSVATTKKPRFEEKGEADMEMEDDEDNTHFAHTSAQPAPTIMTMKTNAASAIGTTNIQPNWFPHQVAATPGTNADLYTETLQQIPVVPPQWNIWPPPVLSPQVVVTANPTSHIPSLMKINVPDLTEIKSMPANVNESLGTMDAAKKKILPAWIREGLEKMEREKQKELKSQQNKLTDNWDDDDSNSQGGTTDNIHSSGYMINNNISTFVESDSSGNEEADDNERTVANVATTSIASQYSKDEADKTKLNVEALKTGKTYEQKLSDLMFVVRRTLTELLLEVTNDEICNVSQEAVNSIKTKATSAHVIPKSAISSITGKLGLAAYDDSSNDSSSSETEAPIINDNNDSEDEIKANILTKRRAFLKTSDEIEERISESAQREEQKLKYYLQREREQLEDVSKEQHKSDIERGGKYTSSNSRPSVRNANLTYVSGKGYEKEFGETSDSKLQFSNGKRQKERTTRFSDNKDSKVASIVAAADYMSQLKSTQIETAAQKINSALLQMPSDGISSSSNSSMALKSSKPLDVPTPQKKTSEKSLGKTSKSSSYYKKDERNKSSDDDDSSSDTSDQSQTSSSRNSSRNSRASTSKSKSAQLRQHHHHHNQKSTSSSLKKSSRSDKYRDYHYEDRKRSRRKYRSSDSEDEADYRNSKSQRSRHAASSSSSYRSERTDRHDTRSRSRSKSHSKYSSKRRKQ